MSKVDIALFLPSLRGGGAERVMVNLAKGFVDSGYRVDLVLAKAEGPYLSQVPEAVRVVDLKSQRVLYSLPGLVSYLKQNHPRALLSTQTHANLVALWARKIGRISTRIAIREATTVSLNSQNAPSLRGKLLPLMLPFFYRWADVVVANSYGGKQDLVRNTGLPLTKVKVIYNPVISSDLFGKSLETLEHPWFRSGAPPVVLGVGRLSKEKGFEVLIRAFAIVSKERKARLVILGEGEERLKLESLAHRLGLQGDVALPGFVDNPYPYMKRAAVFVLSSRWEGLPNVLIEALALGTPVVATDCPNGPREILEDGKWGRLVPVGDAKRLATAIIETLSEAQAPRPLQERAKRFSLDKAVSLYLQVLGFGEEVDEL